MRIILLQSYCVNSRANISWLSEARWLHWSWSSLFQVVACRLLGAKPVHQSMLTCCQWHPFQHTPVKFYPETKLIIHNNFIENVVCEMWSIFSRFLMCDSMKSIDSEPIYNKLSPNSPIDYCHWSLMHIHITIAENFFQCEFRTLFLVSISRFMVVCQNIYLAIALPLQQ